MRSGGYPTRAPATLTVSGTLPLVPSDRMERRALLAPAAMARAAARFAADDRERWMLCQPRAVRRSFVEQVLDDHRPRAVAEEIWMLRQPEAVRESYVREVLGG